MALRLSSLDRPAGAAVATELCTRAQRLLAEEDFAGYGSLFVQLASIEDRHRCYWAGKSLIERGLAASAIVPVVRRPPLLVLLAAGALQMLDREPAEPVLLRLAASSCTSCGAPRARRRCSRRPRAWTHSWRGRIAAPARSQADRDWCPAPPGARRCAPRSWSSRAARWRSPRAPFPPRGCA